MTMSRLVISLMCALTCAGTLGGCGSAPVEHYYTLLGQPSAVATGEQAGTVSRLTVALASVTIPETVDRRELVLRSGANAVTVMDTHRWAESLKSAIPRAIADDLSRDLDGALVSVQADNASHDARYLLYVDITRFHSVLNDAATIDAFWSVRLANGDQLRSDRFSIRVPVRGAGFDELVAAHTQALVQLSDKLAIKIREIDGNRR
jgi:uncharacterized lipoprotein YmbA